jgi:hypothetical protein
VCWLSVRCYVRCDEAQNSETIIFLFVAGKSLCTSHVVYKV